MLKQFHKLASRYFSSSLFITNGLLLPFFIFATLTNSECDSKRKKTGSGHLAKNERNTLYATDNISFRLVLWDHFLKGIERHP